MCIINLFALLFQIATEENRLCHGGKVKPCWLQRVTVFPLVSSGIPGRKRKNSKNKTDTCLISLCIVCLLLVRHVDVNVYVCLPLCVF